jgi:hypothetical protein
LVMKQSSVEKINIQFVILCLQNIRFNQQKGKESKE